MSSFDGSVTVGDVRIGDVFIGGVMRKQMRAFRSTAETGKEFVEKLLAAKGLLPSGWVLTKANAVTPSGTMLIGLGEYTVQMENGLTGTSVHAWRAVIPRPNLF